MYVCIRRKRHIWHYNDMLFATTYKNIMTCQWANNIVEQIENEMAPNM